MRLHVRSSRSCRRSGRGATRWTAACADAVFDIDREGLARDTDSRPRLTAHPSLVDGSKMAFTLRAVGRRCTEDMIRRELEAFLPGFDTFPRGVQRPGCRHLGLGDEEGEQRPSPR
jgi:hypothetical protein